MSDQHPRGVRAVRLLHPRDQLITEEFEKPVGPSRVRRCRRRRAAARALRAVAIARELERILEPARGRLFLTCLIRSDRWSNAYLRFLHRAGELREPWTLEELGRTIAGTWGVVEST